METEIEVKFPNIESDTLRLKLNKLGAIQEHPEVFMRRKTFDFYDKKLLRINAWVRVRDEGDKITLSYKQLNSRTLHGTKEVNLIVDDFDKACDFFITLGLQVKSYQETKREKWKYADVEVTIDTWPWIPSFVELEGRNEESVKKVASDLGLDWSQALYGSVEPVYQMHYDFTDEEIDLWESITFISPPDWLLAKKIKKSNVR